MTELTLEALAKRIEAIEQQQVDAEGQAIREAERKAALEEGDS